MKRCLTLLLSFVAFSVQSFAVEDLYEGFAADQALLRKQSAIKSEGKVLHASSAEACKGAFRIFSRISFLHRKKDWIIAHLGDPKTISDYGVPQEKGKDAPLVYRFDSGYGGWEYRLSFRNDTVYAVEALSLD